MFNINQGKILITRGDCVDVPLFLNQGTDTEIIRYRLKSTDKIYFGVMEPNQRFEDAIIKKVFTHDDLNEEGDVVIKIRTSDTENLLPGKYYYQIKLVMQDEDENRIVNTVVDKKEFWIDE